MIMDRFSQPLSRRRLFEVGGASAGVAALLAACGGDDDAAPGRVGNAAAVPELPRVTVDDSVYLRTLTSLEHAIVEVYAVLIGTDGLDADVADVLQRLSTEHESEATEFADLTSQAGGEPYACANPWLMRRTFRPALDQIVGNEEENIEPTDDATRDALAMADTLETIGSSTSQLFVEKVSDPALRAAMIAAGVRAARRSALVAILANEPPTGYVNPILAGGDEVEPDADGFAPRFAVPARFGQLTPVELQVGAPDEVGVRFTIVVQTPADNAYAYADMSCE